MSGNSRSPELSATPEAHARLRPPHSKPGVDVLHREVAQLMLPTGTTVCYARPFDAPAHRGCSRAPRLPGSLSAAGLRWRRAVLSCHPRIARTTCRLETAIEVATGCFPATGARPWPAFGREQRAAAQPRMTRGGAALIVTSLTPCRTHEPAAFGTRAAAAARYLSSTNKPGSIFAHSS